MSLPSNLQFFLNRLSGYSRNTYRLTTVNNDTAAPGGFVTVDLPNNALVDLSTLSWHFQATTTSTASTTTRMPRHIESIIDSISVEVNGQLISSIPTNYNQVWNIVADTTFGTDTMRRRQVLQNATALTALADTPVSNETNNPYCIQNWLGFLGSVQPQCIDTGALGNVRIRIGLAPASVLIRSSGTNVAPNYSLANMFFAIDCLSIDDGQFHASYANYLAQGGVLELPYTDIYSFSAGNVQSAGTVRFSLSTQSLDLVMATFVETANPNALNAATGTSTYFTRNVGSSSGPTFQWQLNVNNVYSPTYRTTASQSFAALTNALNVSQDALGGMTPELNSQAAWLNGFFVAAYRFCHDADADARLVSGVDSRGSVSQCFFEYSGLDVATAKLALVFAFAKSVLRVGAGRLIEKVA